MEQKISVKDLIIGQMVVGLHLCEKYPPTYERRAGIITGITTEVPGVIVYHVVGKIHKRPDKSYDTSGSLQESEVQVVDQDACKKILELFDLATMQIMAGSLSWRETAEEVNEIITNEFQKVKVKYGVQEV